MNSSSQKILLFAATLVLTAGMAGGVTWLRANQRLGVPGIKADAIPGSVKMAFDLPAKVLDFVSTNVPEDKMVVDTLPQDTSFAQRRYSMTNGFWVSANIVLMGADRTSIHKPEFCLPGQGWKIDEKTNVNIAIGGTHPYQLEAAKWVLSIPHQTPDGQKIQVRGLYVFWFVAHNEQTADHWQRLWWLTTDLLRTGVLQRWAYVSYFAVCLPGQEDATFEKMKSLITASVPDYQLPPDSVK
jgi:hypothetical protein